MPGVLQPALPSVEPGPVAGRPSPPEPGRDAAEAAVASGGPGPHRPEFPCHYAETVPTSPTSALEELARRAKQASTRLAAAPSAARADALVRAADILEHRSAEVLSANADDLRRAEEAGADTTSLDRLRLDDARVASMATGLRAVAGLPDPIGEVVDGWVRPNGLRVQRVRVPLGVVGIIYENRPNVTSDAAGLCLKSGNAVVLRARPPRSRPIW